MRPSASLFDRLFAIDLRALAAFRILLGAFFALDMVGRAFDLEAHYSESGVLPFAGLAFWYGDGDFWSGHHPLWAMFTLHYLDTDAAWAGFLIALNGIAALMLLVGWQTRFAALAVWVLTVSLQNRNPIILHGGDQMLRILVFWAMFLPLGARWSVDAACATLRAWRQPVPTHTASVGTAALMLQTAIIYWGTAALKNSPEWWRDGTAMYYALSIEQYQLPLARLALHLPMGVLKVSTWLALAAEALGPALALLPIPRLRILMVGAFWAFHLLFILPFLDVGPISYVSALLWVPFLPSLFWDALAARARRIAPLAGAWRSLRALRDRRVAARVAARKPLPRIEPSLPMQIVAALSLAFVLQWNIANALHRRGALPFVANLIRQDQFWGMFAPKPMIDDGWFVLQGILEDGSAIDLLQNGAPVRWEKPANINAMYANARWCKLWMNLMLPSNSPYRRYTVDWMRRQWQAQHPDARLQSLSLCYMLKRTPPPDQKPGAPVKTVLWNEVYTTVSGSPQR